MAERHGPSAGRQRHRLPHRQTAQREWGTLESGINVEVPGSGFDFHAAQRLLHPQPFGAGKLGLIGEDVHNGRVETRLEQRQQLGPHAVARNAHVAVRFVLYVLDTAFGEIGLQVGAPALEQRPDDAAVARMHRREPFRAGAAQQPQQKRLRLIVARMAHGHGVRVEVRERAIEKLVTRGMRRVFDGAVRSRPARRRTSSRSTRIGRPIVSASDTQNCSSRSACTRSW